jgi:hypothetical protein
MPDNEPCFFSNDALPCYIRNQCKRSKSAADNRIGLHPAQIVRQWSIRQKMDEPGERVASDHSTIEFILTSDILSG